MFSQPRLQYLLVCLGPFDQLNSDWIIEFQNCCNANWFHLFQTGSFFLRMLPITVASGIFLITISALCQRGFPYPNKGGKYSREHISIPSSEVGSALYQSVDAVKVCMY